MKLSLFERTLTCCLLGAATIAVASGMAKVDPPTEAHQVRFVGKDGDDSHQEVPDDEESHSIVQELEGKLQNLIDQAIEAKDEDKGEKRARLKEALSEVFRKKMETQRARIHTMKERLEMIESQLERRSNLEEQIVERRLGELLGEKDELSWDHEPGMGQGAFGDENPLESLRSIPQEYPFETPEQELEHGNADSMRILRREAERAGVEASEVLRKEFVKRSAEARDKEKSSEDRVRASKAKQRDMEGMQRRETRDSGRLSDLERLRSSLEDQRALLVGGLGDIGDEARLSELRGKLENEARRFERERAIKEPGFSESLRQQLEVLRAQSTALEKQLEAVSKKNEENFKPKK